MDDMIEAHVEKETLIETRNQITSLLGEFRFDIKVWYSNDPEVGEVVEKKKIMGLTWQINGDKLNPAVEVSEATVISIRNFAARSGHLSAQGAT